MRRLGVIARADDGGLGNQTREVVRHLAPDLCIVVLLGRNARGTERLGRFREWPTIFNQGPRLHPAVLKAALPKIDVLYTIEGPYEPALYDWCDHHDVELVIHANAELYKDFDCDRVLVPTPWRIETFTRPTTLLPYPVALDRLQPSQWADVPRFLHLTGPAMLDRQGTQIVVDALQHIREECELIVRHDGPDRDEGIGNVTVRYRAPASEYWDAYPDGSWALIQPRRYGGLSLPIQEAAARGMFTISIDREPESTFYADVTRRVVPFEEMPYPMAGGMIGVADADPTLLAEAIDAFIDDPGDPSIPVEWANAHSWQVLQSDYEACLR